MTSFLGVKPMDKKKICWITSDEFMMVDLPIMPALSKHYDIDWHIIYNKDNKINYTELIAERTKGTSIKCRIHLLHNRRRNPKIIWEYWQILRKINIRQYQCIYFNIEGLPYFFPLVALMFNRKRVICAAHHVTVPYGAVNYHSAKLYMSFIFKYFRNFQVFSKYQFGLLQDNYSGKRSFFAPIALINYGQSDSKLPKGQIGFLFFGYIRDYKRVDVLINAANSVYEKTGKKFKVKIFGSCADWNKYERLIKYPEIFELRIEAIPNEEIPRIFNESHYFVMPYQGLAQSATMTIAFNYGLPIIASDIDSLREIIVDGKNGFLFKNGSVESLAALIASLLDTDEKQYNDLKENVSEYVAKNYSIESIIRPYVDFIDSLWK
jgi:glycosyltransferase involved in cell wall biosynthesis